MEKTADFKVFQASAGAGKTFTLIKEYLKLCLGSAKQVGNFKHILAITFTNAAANEMKAKIVKNLCEIIDLKPSEKHSMATALMEELDITESELKRNAQSLLTCIMHDYSSFCVSTIDAFVQKLSRSFAHDLGLPNQYSVSIDTDEVAEAITEHLGLQISDDGGLLTQSLIDFSENQFANERSGALENLLFDFIKKLLTEKAYQRDEKNRITDLPQYKQTLGFLNDKLRVFEQEVKDYVKRFRAVESQYQLTVEDYWQKKSGVGAFVDKLAKKEYGFPNSYFHTALEKRKCLSDPSKQAANEALLAVLDPLAVFYEKEYSKFLFYRSQRDLLYLYALRAQIRMEFDRLAEEEEVVHISEFNKLLNTVMGDFSVPFVYERIGEQFQHVFVDEFQDTSVLQWQNLLPLVDNGLAANKMSMVVGDGKQSIYRFRSGEVEQIVNLPEVYALPQDERKSAFLQYQNNLRAHYAFKNLDTNHRSFANVVRFNNAFFEQAYLGLSEAFRKVYVDKKPNSDEGVAIFQKNFIPEEGMVQVELYDVENQSNYVLQRIEEIVRELTESKGYSYQDITILVRKTEYGSQIANYLNNKEIPVVSQVSILLKTSDKVQVLLHTLRYLIQADNEIHVANLLYYWNLTQHPDFDGDVSHWFDSVKGIAAGTVDVETVMGIGAPGTLRSVLSQSASLYDLCATLSRVYHFDTLHDAFLNYFMEEVFKWQSGTMEDIVDFLSLWEKKKDTLSVKSVSQNAVNIMTIHKSKGLEFPVVIYPEAIINLDEKLNASKAAEEWLRPEDLGFEAIPNIEKVLFKLDKNAENMGDLALQRVEREKESNRLDNLNLLYVAFTRAVQRLYVIAKQSEAMKPNLIRDFFTEEVKPRVTETVSGDGFERYRFGDAEFRNPNEKKSVSVG